MTTSKANYGETKILTRVFDRDEFLSRIGTILPNAIKKGKMSFQRDGQDYILNRGNSEKGLRYIVWHMFATRYGVTSKDTNAIFSGTVGKEFADGNECRDTGGFRTKSLGSTPWVGSLEWLSQFGNKVVSPAKVDGIRFPKDTVHRLKSQPKASKPTVPAPQDTAPTSAEILGIDPQDGNEVPEQDDVPTTVDA